MTQSNINFKDTKTAFNHKTNAQLKKAFWLFKSFSWNWVVVYGPKVAAFLIKIHFPIKGLIKSTVFEQFCGGETAEESSKAIELLSRKSVGSILDYSVEGEDSEIDFDNTFEELKKTILLASNNKNIPFSVFKTTGIGRFTLLEKLSAKSELTENEMQEALRFKKRFEGLCLLAYNNQVKLLVDAEETWIQDIIDEMAYEMMLKYNQKNAIIYNTIQCYRTNRLHHIEHIFKELNCIIGLKIVRGAYMEKERRRAEKMGYISPINSTKLETDKEFDNCVNFCLKNYHKFALCVGTHNEESCLNFANKILELNLDKNSVNLYLAQLYGMSDNISFVMSDLGYRIAKYVPYGPVKSVLPYLSRRAQENTSVKGQSGREISLIKKELERRTVDLKY